MNNNVCMILLFLNVFASCAMDHSNTVLSLKEITARHLASQPLSPEVLSQLSLEDKEYVASVATSALDLSYDESKENDKAMPRLTHEVDTKKAISLAWLDDSTLAYEVLDEMHALSKNKAQSKDRTCFIWDLQTGAEYVYRLDINKLKTRNVILKKDEKNFQVRFENDDMHIADYEKKPIMQWLSQKFKVKAEEDVQLIVPSGNNVFVIWAIPQLFSQPEYRIAQFPYDVSSRAGIGCYISASFNKCGEINNFFLTQIDEKGKQYACEFSSGNPELIKKIIQFDILCVNRNGSLIASIDLSLSKIEVIPNLRAPLPLDLLDEFLAAQDKKAALARILFKAQRIDIEKLK